MTWSTFVLPVPAVVVVACISSPTAPAPLNSEQLEHRDRGGRFAFSYPARMGSTSIGTNDGFENRVAAIRFSVFSGDGIGGEAVLTQGPVLLDVQAAGGLYDAIAGEALPADLKRVVESVLSPLGIGNLCQHIGSEQHIDVNGTALASLIPAHRQALVDLDRMGNISPVVLQCAARGEIVTFDKEAAVVPSGPRRRIYGAVRFLTGRYSSFQLIRAGGAIAPETLNEMQAVVASWRPLD